LSKDALEQCIGDSVQTFVPPYNQPFDYPGGLAISLSERREAAGGRTGLADLCQALAESGYRACRVAYSPLPYRLLEWAAGRRFERPRRPRAIAGVRCLRLNTPCGFGPLTEKIIESNLDREGLWVVYGHPHSTTEDGAQSISHLERLLGVVNGWERQGRIKSVLPREMLTAVA
jgi:hypothetical protein